MTSDQRGPDWNGGKFPNRESKGMALSEFVDDARVNRSDDGTSAPSRLDSAVTSLGGPLGAALAAAGVLAVAALAVTLMSRRHTRRRQPKRRLPAGRARRQFWMSLFR